MKLAKLQGHRNSFSGGVPVPNSTPHGQMQWSDCSLHCKPTNGLYTCSFLLHKMQWAIMIPQCILKEQNEVYLKVIFTS